MENGLNAGDQLACHLYAYHAMRLHGRELEQHLRWLGYSVQDASELLGWFLLDIQETEASYPLLDPPPYLKPRVWLWRLLRQRLPSCSRRMGTGPAFE